MRSARKLSIVADCPMPETPIKPVEYVPCALKPKGTPIKANPHPGELHRIMFAQSAATRGGVVPDAREIIQSMPAVTEKHDSPSRAVTVGSFEGETK